MGKKKPGLKKGKKKRKKHPSSKKYKMYSLKGDKLEKRRNCPRCGPGIFLAVRKGRVHCGRCSYTEFTKE
jgi:small subunit ribosomal protein S27Ae